MTAHTSGGHKSPAEMGEKEVRHFSRAESQLPWLTDKLLSLMCEFGTGKGKKRLRGTVCLNGRNNKKKKTVKE